MHLHLKYTLPDGYNKQSLINEFADHYTIKKESAVDGTEDRAERPDGLSAAHITL